MYSKKLTSKVHVRCAMFTQLCDLLYQLPISQNILEFIFSMSLECEIENKYLFNLIIFYSSTVYTVIILGPILMFSLNSDEQINTNWFYYFGSYNI